jgi:glucosyl-3-phosphoglycerate phosphatase
VCNARKVPGGETFDQLQQRAHDALKSLLATVGEAGTALVVTHGGVIRALLARLIGLTPDRLVPVEPASATVLQLLPTPRLEAFNLHLHPALPDGTD